MAKLLIFSSTFLGLVLSSGTASADGVSVRASGSVRVNAGVHVSLGGAAEFIDRTVRRIRFATPPASVRVTAGPRPVRRYRRPLPPCRYRCAAVVPSYYVSQPVYVRHAPPMAPVVYAAPKPMPRWSIGAFAGSMEIDGLESGADFGLLGQYRLSESFSLEAEISKSEMLDTGRIDRRLGGALLFDFATRRSLSPYLLAGAGIGQTDVGNGDVYAEQGYGELGIGLRLKFSDRFQLIGDARVGSRDTRDDVAYRSVEPVGPSEQSESYGRFRLGGLLSF